MAKSELIVTLLDYWLDDPIDRGYKLPMLYMIYEINNKIYVKWEEANDFNS